MADICANCGCRKASSASFTCGGGFVSNSNNVETGEKVEFSVAQALRLIFENSQGDDNDAPIELFLCKQCLKHLAVLFKAYRGFILLTKTGSYVSNIVKQSESNGRESGIVDKLDPEEFTRERLVAESDPEWNSEPKSNSSDSDYEANDCIIPDINPESSSLPCSRSTRSKALLNEDELSCDICFQVLSEKDDFLRHLLLQHDIRTCLPCDEKFSTKEAYREHLKSDEHKYQRQPKLPKAPRKRKAKEGYVPKKKNVDFIKKVPLNPGPQPISKCFNCKEEFEIVENWATHHLNAHRVDMGWGTAPEAVAQYHPSPARRKYRPCPECGKAFYLPHLVRRHMEVVHPVEKLFNCSECNKNFPTEAHLKKHFTATHGGKKYLCGICGATFRAKDNLQRHERVHLGTLEKPFECDICKCKFESSNRLRDHKLVHSDSEFKMYSCELCTSTFKTKHHLSKHQLHHKNQALKPHKCEFCGKNYTNRSLLKEHLKRLHNLNEIDAKKSAGIRDTRIFLVKDGQIVQPTSTPTKPKTCHLCERDYSRREYLTSHLIAVHNLTEDAAREATGIQSKRTFTKLPKEAPSTPDAADAQSNDLVPMQNIPSAGWLI